MKTRVVSAGLMVGAAVIGFAWCGQPTAGQDPPKATPVAKWEYKKTIGQGEEEMNKLGAEGWELVTEYASKQMFGSTAIYKRPKR